MREAQREPLRFWNRGISPKDKRVMPTSVYPFLERCPTQGHSGIEATTVPTVRR